MLEMKRMCGVLRIFLLLIPGKRWYGSWNWPLGSVLLRWWPKLHGLCCACFWLKFGDAQSDCIFEIVCEFSHSQCCGMIYVIGPEEILRGSGIMPSALEGFIDANIWVHFRNSILVSTWKLENWTHHLELNNFSSQAAEESVCEITCGIEACVCCMFCFVCSFCFHPLLKKWIRLAKYREAASHNNELFYHGRAVFTVCDDLSILVNTDNIRSTSAPSFHPHHHHHSYGSLELEPSLASAADGTHVSSRVFDAVDTSEDTSADEKFPHRQLMLTIPEETHPGQILTGCASDGRIVKVRL